MMPLWVEKMETQKKIKKGNRGFFELMYRSDEAELNGFLWTHVEERWARTKYQNFLIFIALPNPSEMERWNQKKLSP